VTESIVETRTQITVTRFCLYKRRWCENL